MKVSIVMVTYNHEKYIAQAVESVLMQETNFDYELIIGEDCSQDKTRAIVMDFQRRFPERIRLLLPEKNLGGSGKTNFLQTLAAAQGQYVALLEGDDYWTSPHKLQKQVDFLDSHPECAICFHKSNMLYEDGSQPTVQHPENVQPISTLEDLLQGNFIIACSVMFRRGLFGEFPDWFYRAMTGDWAIHILNAQYGKIGFINETMSTYRLHSGGFWSLKNKEWILRENIKMLKDVDRYLNFKYHRTIKCTLFNYYLELTQLYEQEGALRQARDAALGSVMACPLRQRAVFMQRLKLWLKLSLELNPNLYSLWRRVRRRPA